MGGERNCGLPVIGYIVVAGHWGAGDVLRPYCVLGCCCRRVYVDRFRSKRATKAVSRHFSGGDAPVKRSADTSVGPRGPSRLTLSHRDQVRRRDFWYFRPRDGNPLADRSHGAERHPRRQRGDNRPGKFGATRRGTYVGEISTAGLAHRYHGPRRYVWNTTQSFRVMWARAAGTGARPRTPRPPSQS
jgi:hypothetical protein